MEIREATITGVSAIQEVARETWHAPYDDVIGADAVDEQVDEWDSRDSAGTGVSLEDWPYLIAERKGAIVGYTSGGPTEDGPADGVVTSIKARPAHWGEGVGSARLRAPHDRLRDLGCESVWLAVLADNDAWRSFCDDHGYEVHGDDETEIGGVVARELVLRRDL